MSSSSAQFCQLVFGLSPVPLGNFRPFTSTTSLAVSGPTMMKSADFTSVSPSTDRFASSVATNATPRPRRYASNAAS